MNCYLCQSSDIAQIHDRCRDSETVTVKRCGSCGLVFLSDAKNITDDFYESSGMYEFEIPDRKILLAEEAPDTDRRVAYLAPLVKGKRYLDFGCGTGAVASGLKKLGAEVYGVELNKAHREAIGKEFGIEVRRSLEDLKGSFDLISLFHVLEHLKNPIAELSSLRARLSKGGCLIVEVPHALDALLSLYDLQSFKDFTYWSCHLYLFTEKTLTIALQKAGFKKIEVAYVQRYPLANHLYWLAKGKPGGQKEWSHFREPGLDAQYAQKLTELKATDTIIAIATVE